MPGNEVADKVHDFFEQENLAQGQHQSQAANRNWPTLNSNLCVENQRQIGTPFGSNPKNYNVQQSESERGNVRQSSHMPLGTNPTQLTLRPDFTKSQSRNQPLSLNGFMHEHQGFPTRQNQAEFLGEDTASDRHNLMSRGLSVLESQQGNAPEHSPALTRNSERLETAEAPINFDFLGGQQQLMRAQQPGMPQPRPRQQSGLNDMQLWQQHLMLKQLQELQRQQQLQQLDQEARQQNPMNQLSAIAKQAAGDQLPALVNGTPIHDVSNSLWPSEVMGGDSKVPSTSQMFMVGNTNWAQRGGSPVMQGFPNGLMFSHEQGQTLRPMGLAPQQLDQSLYGAPIASTRGVFNQYHHLQGISQDCTDMLSKAGGNQVEKPIMQLSTFNNSFQGDQGAIFQDQVSMQAGASVSKQGFQGKSLFEHVPIQGLNTGALSGNFHQTNSLPRNAQVQEFLGRQERGGWSGNLQEKAATQVGPSQGLVSLDPTEEKILFNTEDNFWDASFGRSGIMGTGGYGNPSEGTDYLNSFPSIQSGSWSALMQSAVAEASSSDTGLQDEWSGLSYQKTELSSVNQPTTVNDSRKQQANWVDNNFQRASSLTPRPFPLFDDANMSPSSHSIHGYQQPGIKLSFEQSEKVQLDASHESIQQSPKDASRWLDRSPQQKPLVEGSHQVQVPTSLENASEGAWAGQIYEQSESAAHSAGMELNAQNMQGSWVHRQSTSYNSGSQPCNKPNGWNINESLSPSGDAALNTRKNENSVQLSRSNDKKRGMHTERDHDGIMWKADGNRVTNSFTNSTGGLEQVKSGTGSPQINREDTHMNNFTAVPDSSTTKTSQETNQQVPNSHHLDYGKHVIDSVKYKGDENVGKYQHQLNRDPRVMASSMNNSDRSSGETYDKKQDNCYQKELSNDSYNSSQLHHTVTKGGVRENSWISVSDSRASAGGNQKSTGQVGRKASASRRFQYHPMGEVNVDSADTTKQITHSQGLSQQAAQGSKNHEQGYFAHSKFAGHVPDNAIDMEKGQLPDFQGNTKGSVEVPSRGVLPGYESTVSGSFDRSAGFFAPNKRTGQTSQNMLELLHKVDQSREHSTVKHFGSSDCSPSSEMPEAEASVARVQRNKSSSSQGFGLRLAPPSQRVPVSNQVFSSQNSSHTVNDLNSRHVDSEAGEKVQTWLAPTSLQSLPPHEMSHREHWDNKASISGQRGNEASHLNMEGNSATFTSAPSYPRNQLQRQHVSSASGQVMTDQSVNISFDRLASHFRQTHDPHSGAVGDQSVQASLPSATSRIPPFSLAPPADTSQPINTNSSYVRVSGQQLPVLESVPVSQPSVTSAMSQQGAFSAMLHNVWTNVSSQQRLAGGPAHKVPSNVFQSTDSSNNNLGTTSWATQKPDDQYIKKGGNGPSEFGTCAINSQRFAYGEEQPGKEISWQQIPSEKVDLAPQTAGASQGQQSVFRHISDTNSIASGLSPASTHQQELDRGRYGKDPALVSQTELASFQNPATFNRDFEAFGRSLKPSHALHQSYSLLHQVQAMKDVETDPNKRGGKRFRGADTGLDAQRVAANTGQQLLYGYNTMVRDAADNEPDSAARHTSFPSGDRKMVSFPSDAREDQNTASSQLVIGDVPPQDITFGRNDSLNPSSHFNMPSVRSEPSQINPRMAPSWFEQYGTFKNGQMLPMYDAWRTAKTAEQQFFSGKASESLHVHTSMEKINAADASQVGRVWQSTTTALVASERLSPSHSLPPEFIDQSLTVVRPKKRKSATLELLPWHKEVTHGSQRLQNFSMAEQDWAQAANRLIEKVEDEAEMVEDGQPMLRPRRRLILTTQLMQQLLRPAPAAILSADAASDYETVTYFVAKLALGDACSLISCSGSDSRVHPDNGNTTSGKLKTSERIGDQYFSKVVEDFIGRARKLESDLLRLDKRSSILDIRVDCQDLEKFSVINRFAKFHGRGHADGVETSSSSDAARNAHKIFPQRYVTAVSMPRNLPEGVQCLSL